MAPKSDQSRRPKSEGGASSRSSSRSSSAGSRGAKPGSSSRKFSGKSSSEGAPRRDKPFGSSSSASGFKKSSGPRTERSDRSFGSSAGRPERSSDRQERPFGNSGGRSERSSDRPFNREGGRPERSSDRPDRPFGSSGSRSERPSERPFNKEGGRSERSSDRPDRPFGGSGGRSERSSDRPFNKEGGRSDRSFGSQGGRPEKSSDRSFNREGGRPEKPSSDRPDKSFYKDGGRSERSDRPFNKEGGGERPERPFGGGDFSKRPSRAAGGAAPRSSGFKKRAEGEDQPRARKQLDTEGSFFFKKKMGDARFQEGNKFKPEGEKSEEKSERPSSRFDKKREISSQDFKKSFGKSQDSYKKFDTPRYKMPKEPLNKDLEVESLNSDIRLNRYIANAGICSRREADELIRLGMIKVNGKVIDEMGYQVKKDDVVKYGSRILNPEKLVYILINKPKDFITTTEDPQERKTVMELVKTACKERVYPVGRLDRNTTGLLVLTNDGELADKLTHPSHGIKKIYQVDLDKPISTQDAEEILNGVVLEEGKALVDSMAIISDNRTQVGLEIHIGWNRVVRRIFEAKGYQVTKLDRVSYAGLTKKDLGRGQWRFLTEKEVITLKYYL